MTKQEILDYVMDSPGNTNRAVLSGMLDQMAGGGGGDFSIAKVTIVNNSDIEHEINGALCIEDEKHVSSSGISFPIESNTTITVGVILYKEEAQVHFPTYPTNITLAGDITGDMFGFWVHGDGTITIDKSSGGGIQ